jgi:hypothetical protein
MRQGENNRNLTDLEKKAGQKAAKNVRNALKATVRPFKDTGAMLRAIKVSPKMKYGGLDNLTINATRVTFIQHYGFERTASNRAKYTLDPRGYFTEAFNRTKALETLADEIGELRAEEITSKINW